MDTMPGLDSGKMAQSALGNIAVSAPETAGDRKISTRAEMRPV